MNNTTINEITINNEVYVLKSSIKSSEMACNIDGLKPVLIRSYAAGVHYGYLKEEKFTEAGKVVVLVNTKRIFYWSGAASLSQLALEGVKNGDKCKISVALPEDEIVNVIETIPLTKAALENLNGVKTWKI